MVNDECWIIISWANGYYDSLVAVYPGLVSGHSCTPEQYGAHRIRYVVTICDHMIVTLKNYKKWISSEAFKPYLWSAGWESDAW